MHDKREISVGSLGVLDIIRAPDPGLRRRCQRDAAVGPGFAGVADELGLMQAGDGVKPRADDVYFWGGSDF